MMEFIIPVIVAAVLGTGYAAVFLFYNREKAKEGCVSETGGHGFGCAHCGACGGKKETGKQEEKEDGKEKEIASDKVKI